MLIMGRFANRVIALLILNQTTMAVATVRYAPFPEVVAVRVAHIPEA